VKLAEEPVSYELCGKESARVSLDGKSASLRAGRNHWGHLAEAIRLYYSMGSATGFHVASVRAAA